MRGHIHVTGVAGVGMSALAQALTWSYERVTGSDRYFDRGENLPVFDVLQKAGIELVKQDGSAVGAETEAVVVSTAIEQDNPDIAQAKALSVPVKHRARVLAELAEGKRILAVAGTAGKTTTTGMLGWILEQTGFDPTVINGGAVRDWATDSQTGAVRRGAPDAPWVLEVDESDRSLLHFSPEWSILTNISQDHFSLEEVQELFRQYARQVGRGLVIGGGVESILGPSMAETVRMDAVPERRADGTYAIAWRGRDLSVPQPGLHNACNAGLAAELAAQLGAKPDDIAAALSRFGGIHRRLEKMPGTGAIQVIDDYAHNPAKLEAAWQAVATPQNRVLGVWRPHGFGPLRSMLDALADSFTRACRPQDRLWLLPVYDAGGTTDRSIQSDALVGKLTAAGIAAATVDTYEQLEEEMLQQAHPGDTLLIMGARDPGLPAFARTLAEKFQQHA